MFRKSQPFKSVNLFDVLKGEDDEGDELLQSICNHVNEDCLSDESASTDSNVHSMYERKKRFKSTYTYQETMLHLNELEAYEERIRVESQVCSSSLSSASLL
eukprot:TRINITY_DN10176_c0_g2_i1.p2 TRINITY_DN10176_c0_g2~~TRINITY_DN10176_c0_g2_i1.p2  ORF type:complete len:102 (+),score=20.66 TRINITY_DN10176_c0_g2_i1:377-682(+)